MIWSQPLIFSIFTPQEAEGHFFDIAFTASSDFCSLASFSARCLRYSSHNWPSWKGTSHDRQ